MISFSPLVFRLESVTLIRLSYAVVWSLSANTSGTTPDACTVLSVVKSPVTEEPAFMEPSELRLELLISTVPVYV